MLGCIAYDTNTQVDPTQLVIDQLFCLCRNSWHFVATNPWPPYPGTDQEDPHLNTDAQGGQPVSHTCSSLRAPLHSNTHCMNILSARRV